MSSILEALKRLEKEDPRTRRPLLWVRRHPDPSRVWRRAALLGLGGVLLAVGVGLWFADVRQATEQGSPGPLRPVAPAPADPLAVNVSPPPGAPNTPPSLEPPGETPTTGTVTPGTTALPIRVPPANVGVAAVGRTTVATAVSGPQQAPDPTPAGDAAAVGAPLENPAVIPPEDNVARKTLDPPPSKSAAHGLRLESTADDATDAGGAALPRLSDDNIFIQAISWAPEAERRLAVVNNHIVREGGWVAGYRVTRINTDDLILAKEGQAWRLPFVVD